MKKIALTALVCVLTAGAASADFVGPKKSGGMMKDNNPVATVAQVKEMKDDSRVVLNGKIVSQLSNDKYMFEDKTGNIIVEIDKEDWRGITIEPADMVKLHGELDKGWFETEVDVDYIEKIQ